MSPDEADMSKGVTATEHLERTISNDAVLKVAEHADLEAIEETTPGKFVWLCACATAIGGMLFGYDVRFTLEAFASRGLGMVLIYS